MQFANDEVPADVAKNRIDIVSRCIERGINYMDPVTLAELMAYGIALKGRRERMYVAASSDAYNPVRQEQCTVQNQLANIDDCLTRLRTDYLDVWRPMFRQEGGHPDSDIEACVLAFEKAREQGKVRWLGMSSHNRAFIQHVIEEFPQYSVVIFPYTAMSKERGADLGSLEPNQVVEIGTGDRRHSGDVSRSIFDVVRENDIGVVTIKPFGGGSLFRTRITFEENATSEDDDRRARLTLACILCNEKITTTIPGMTTVQQVDNNVRASKERRSLLTQEGLSVLDEAAKEMWATLPEEYRWLRDWEWV
jgi:aryl-alcohol dehydrogenase-like predicted oxidoreductase